MVAQRNIALWSHPRSISTSVERYFRERGDCWCHHEPFMYFYYLEKHGEPYPGFEPDDDRPRQLLDIANMVTTKLDGRNRQKHIFFKDMSYYISDQLSQLREMMKATVSVFLIRNPKMSLASYSKLDKNFSLEEGGLEAQWKHYQTLISWGIKPLVIDANTISFSPEITMRKICSFVGIPFNKRALSWDSNALPEDWQQTKAWHQSSINSTGFGAPDTRNPDEVFQTAAKTKPELYDYLTYHQPFYDMLKAEIKS